MVVKFNKRTKLPVNVKEMARKRIENIFASGLPVYMSMSGGKDSIVLASLTYNLIREGRINPRQLVVTFIDEEAMHEDVIEIVADWRKKFLATGAKFDWWCIEVIHYNCFNMLENDETFICWDRYAKDRWVRPMPKFAKTNHPELRAREESYQDFLTRITSDGISITGVRVSESIHRLMNFRMDPKNLMYQPIYDWKDGDIWLYIKEQQLDFPETYVNLYRTGITRRGMRLSQFFSIDTAKTLVQLSEFDPDLMKRVQRREPNANLILLYWDSEMFRKSSKGRDRAGHAEGVESEKDYEAEVFKLLGRKEFSEQSHLRSRRSTARSARRAIIRHGKYMDASAWETLYNIIYAGDPKGRSIRALETNMNTVKRKAGNVTK